MSKLTVVTGAAGFIGSNVVATLNQRGQDHLLLVDAIQLALKLGCCRRTGIWSLSPPTTAPPSPRWGRPSIATSSWRPLKWGRRTRIASTSPEALPKPRPHRASFSSRATGGRPGRGGRFRCWLRSRRHSSPRPVVGDHFWDHASAPWIGNECRVYPQYLQSASPQRIRVCDLVWNPAFAVCQRMPFARLGLALDPGRHLDGNR